MRRNAGFMDQVLGMNFYATTDVTSSGGDYVGFAYAPGAVGLVHGSVQPVIEELGDTANVLLSLPQFGFLVTKSTNNGETRARIDAVAYMGIGTLDASIAPQFLFKSAV